MYKSSEPALWDSPNLQGAKAKLLKAATTLADLETDITKARWTAVLQALGASRDLREAVGFLTKEQPAAAIAAKKVLRPLIPSRRRSPLALSPSSSPGQEGLPLAPNRSHAPKP